MQRNSKAHWGKWERAGREDRHRAKTTNYKAQWEEVRGSEGTERKSESLFICLAKKTPIALLLLLSHPPPSPTSPEFFLHLGWVFIVAHPVILHRHRDGPQPAWLTHTDEVRQNHTTLNTTLHLTQHRTAPIWLINTKSIKGLAQDSIRVSVNCKKLRYNPIFQSTANFYVVLNSILSKFQTWSYKVLSPFWSFSMLCSWC